MSLFETIKLVPMQRDPIPDPDPAGFINPDSEPKVGIQKFGIQNPGSVRDPLEYGTAVFSVAQKPPDI
jgi:hypothetical protein